MSTVQNGDRHSGQIKWFNLKKGYGFIESASFGKDVFLHVNEVERSGIDADDIQPGGKVYFSVKQNHKGVVATEIGLSA